MSRTKSQRGSTLVEIIVVFMVLGLLMAAIGPEMGIWMRNLRVRTAAESVLSGLQQARMEAMRRNRTVGFSLVSNLTSGCTLLASSSAWVVSLDDPTGRCNITPSATVAPRIVAARAAGEGITASNTTVSVVATQADNSTASSVVFDGFGRVVGTTGISTINVTNATIGNDYRALRVTVSAAGAVRMCEPAISLSTNDPRRC